VDFIGVIHCVRDLKQILRNPLVIRHDNVQVNQRQRTFIPKRMVNKSSTLKLVLKRLHLKHQIPEWQPVC
jgi:hypothetical protein